MRYLYISLLLIAIIPSIVKGQIITTVAGSNTQGFSGDGGPATAAELSLPNGIVVDAVGNMYISDDDNNRIRKVNTSGIITTYVGTGSGAGTPTCCLGGDGGQATAAEIDEPYGVTVDAVGNLYIADTYNNRIRKVDTSGIITTIAGSSLNIGFSGDGGQATDAKLYYPEATAFDINGNLYISDNGNSRIRMINTTGIITTVAGNGTFGFSGDGGPATNAEFNSIYQIAFDPIGNLYITDYFNNRIRKINTAGIISTVAGNGTAGSSGDGGQATSAELHAPVGLTCDIAGNIYIAEQQGNRIRKVNTSGIINTIVGNGIANYSGDGGQASSAEIAGPDYLSFDALGNLYIADAENERIRKVTNVAAAGIEQFANSNEQVMVYPNPNAGIFQVSFSGNSTNTSIEIYNTVGACVHRQITTSSNCQIDLSSLNEGIYNISLQSNEGVVNKRIVIVR